jgi:hypothetical protein
MKKIKGFIVIFSCFFVILSGYFLLGQSNKKIVQQDVATSKNVQIEEIPVEEIPVEEKIYITAYQRGRRNFQNQMGIKNDDEKIFSYTVSKEISEEDEAKYEEIITKGYADGYHKACENFDAKRCPY